MTRKSDKTGGKEKRALLPYLFGVITGVALVGVVVGVLFLPGWVRDRQADRTPGVTLIMTPEQKDYALAMKDYLDVLNAEGVTLSKEIGLTGGENFIFLYRPNSGEVTKDEINTLTELVLRTATILESRGGFKQDDIDMAFQRPQKHNLVFLRRDGIPEALGGEEFGEGTISVDNKLYTSIINFAGPTKSGRRDLASTWTVIQALCLAYTGQEPNSDPQCNIFTASAAAGWIGMDKTEAATMIDGYGMTSLSYLANQDYRYRFIEFVYNEFLR